MFWYVNGRKTNFRFGGTDRRGSLHFVQIQFCPGIALTFLFCHPTARLKSF